MRLTHMAMVMACLIAIAACEDSKDSGSGSTTNAADSSLHDASDQVDASTASDVQSDAASLQDSMAGSDAATSDVADAADAPEDVTITQDTATEDGSLSDGSDQDGSSLDGQADSSSGGPDSMGPDTIALDAAGPDAADTMNSNPGVVRLIPDLVEPSSQGGSFEVICEAVDAKGQKLKNPGDWQITFSPSQAFSMGKFWGIAKSGTVTVTCTSAQAKVSVSTELVVAAESLDPAVSGMAKTLYKALEKVNFVLNTPTDQVNQSESIKELKTMLVKWDAPFVTATEVLLKPANDLPTLAQVKAAGIAPTKDDDPWVKQIDLVVKKAKELVTLIKNNPGSTLTDQQYQSVFSAIKALQNQEMELAKLKPSAAVLYEHRSKLNELALKVLPELTELHTKLIADQLYKTEQKDKNCNGCFSITGLALSVGVQYALDAVPTYNKLLKDVGWAVGQMTVMLTIKKFVDNKFSPTAKSPVIDLIVSLGQGVVPGNKLAIMGSDFGSKPGECGVIFLTPALSKGIIDSLKMAAQGMPSTQQLQSKSAWEAAKAVKSAIDQFVGTAKLLAGTPETMSNGVVMMYSQPNSTFATPAQIELGTVPKKANCSSGPIALPLNGVLIPICRDRGVGASMSVIVIGKKC